MSFERPPSPFGHITACAETDPEAHVWKVRLDLELDREADRLSRLARSLSADERARAERFRSARDRQRFIVARGSLRAILGAYLGTPADQVRFAYTSDQKPVLADDETVHFNLSHSHALALVAVARGREVGVDIELLRTDFAPDALAKRFFSAAEYAALAAAPPQDRHRAFLVYWVCKEAYLKGCGVGLRRPLSAFSVSLQDLSIRLHAGADEAAAPFRLRLLDPDPHYLAAVAVATP